MESLGQSKSVTFGSKIGNNLTNPISLSIDNYEGLIIEISYWDADNSQLVPYEQVNG